MNWAALSLWKLQRRGGPKCGVDSLRGFGKARRGLTIFVDDYGANTGNGGRMTFDTKLLWVLRCCRRRDWGGDDGGGDDGLATSITIIVISTWGRLNNVDLISLSYTRHADDVKELRAFLQSQDLHETQIYAKIENAEGLEHFDEILQEADGIILSRGNLGIDLPPEKVFLYQKSTIHNCNLVGKPAIITRVMDSMTDNLRPTRAEATDVANAVLDGADCILLGAETLRGVYPVEAIRTVGSICAEAETVSNQPNQFKAIVKYVGEPMSHDDSVASSAVRAAIKVKAAVIIVLTSSGNGARLVAKYRPPMPVLAVLTQFQASSSALTVTSQVRQLLLVRGIYPIYEDSIADGESASSKESSLKLAMSFGRSAGIVKNFDRAVIFQKIRDSFVVKIVNCCDY